MVDRVNNLRSKILVEIKKDVNSYNTIRYVTSKHVQIK